MSDEDNGRARSAALTLLVSTRPRNVRWLQAGGLLFGDWGTSRLYVLGLAFLVAGRSAFWLVAAMSLLILAVGWAYTQICRIYPDGGGVYTAGRKRHALLGVVGALLLMADYTVTASLSAVEAFHYLGLGRQHIESIEYEDPDHHIEVPHAASEWKQTPLLDWRGPGLWAVVAILFIGAMNLLGPRHTAVYAIFAAGGMIFITLLIVAFALPRIDWSRLQWGTIAHPPLQMWQGFVYIVLALSGVEAIANLTGVMRKPVYTTARKSIWLVAVEVALFNALLAVVMISLATVEGAAQVGAEPLTRERHAEDMLAFLGYAYIGTWGEWMVRIVGGLLLLSAANTAVNGLMSVIYVMSRDGELPRWLQKLNGFGAPWLATIVAASLPVVVLLFAHDLQTLASLYAIGVVGAVAIDTSLCTIHPRLRKRWRKLAMGALALLLIAIWITLALTKWHALAFVTVVLTTGLILRQLTRIAAKRRPKPSLLRQAIVAQLPPDALSRPKVLLATAGSDTLADAALRVAAADNASLVVCFVRQVALSYKVKAERKLTLDTDPAAQALFTDFLEHGHKHAVPIIPVYDTGPDAAELIAEHAAMNGVSKVLLGSSRRGAIHKIIKGSFQRRLESFLPQDIPVHVVDGAKGPEKAHN